MSKLANIDGDFPPITRIVNAVWWLYEAKSATILATKRRAAGMFYCSGSAAALPMHCSDGMKRPNGTNMILIDFEGDTLLWIQTRYPIVSRCCWEVYVPSLLLKVYESVG